MRKVLEPLPIVGLTTSINDPFRPVVSHSHARMGHKLFPALLCSCSTLGHVTLHLAVVWLRLVTHANKKQPQKQEAGLHPPLRPSYTWASGSLPVAWNPLAVCAGNNNRTQAFWYANAPAAVWVGRCALGKLKIGRTHTSETAASSLHFASLLSLPRSPSPQPLWVLIVAPASSFLPLQRFPLVIRQAVCV